METTTATFTLTHNKQLPSENGTFSVMENGSLIIHCKSSAIQRIQYMTNMEILVVAYQGGKIYYYKNVPAKVVFHLLVTESFGKFVNTHIKPNYEFFT